MPSAATVLDITGVTAAEREPALFQRLDALAPDRSLQIVSGVSPGEVSDWLQAGRPGEFDCALLEEAPAQWRIEIRRRPDPAGPRGVAEFMQWDHDRLDALVAAAEQSVQRRDLAAARARFAEFRTGLARHIRMEEEVLFPAFERGGGDAMLTMAMRHEHADILTLLARAGAVLESDVAPEGFPRTARRRLLPLLEHHGDREERVVYPQTDHGLAASGREVLVLAMQRL